MTRELSVTSYFNPVSEHHRAADLFKALSSSQKAVIVVLSILSTILSLPMGGLGGLGLFRKMTEMYSETDQKTHDVQQKIHPPVQKTIPTSVPMPKAPVQSQQETRIEILEDDGSTEDLTEPLLDEKQEDVAIVIEEPIEKSKKGYIVQLLGRERVLSWCPKIGALVGGVLGYYGVNLGVNFGIYFTQSKLAESRALSQAAEKLTPFIDKCVTCHIDMDENPLDMELAKIIQVNKASNQVLHNAADALTKASLQAAAKPILSVSGAKTALHFAKDAATGDVPISILRLANYAGGAIGAASGYLVGKHVASWLDS